MAVPASQNELKFINIQYAEGRLGNWGAYKEKVKWKLNSKASKKGFVLQVVTFKWDIKWVSNNQPLTQSEIDDAMGRDMGVWNEYSELWLISASKQEPAGTLNQDHFTFGGIPQTYGSMTETGKAYFFESDQTPDTLGFSKNPDCPAGAYMPSKQGVFIPSEPIVRTPNTLDHKVAVTWNNSGSTTLVEEIPKKP